MSKGYGNLNPRFAKYFKKRNEDAKEAWKRKAGAHEKGARRPDIFDDINEYVDEEIDALKQRVPSEILDVGERVVVVGPGHTGDEGRIVLRRQDNGDLHYGVVFDWDMNMHPVYFTGKDLERA